MKNNTLKFTFVSACVAVCLLFFSACEPNSNNGGNGGGNTPPEDTVKVEAPSAEKECAQLNPGQFCINGLDFLALGDSLVWNPNIEVKVEGATLKDTIFTEAMMSEAGEDSASWFVKIVDFPDGKRIFMESDFEDPHLLGRIRIESPAYKHTTGVGVGSSVADLKANFAELVPLPFPEFGVMELIASYSGRRLIFHVPLGDYYVPEKAEYALSDLPENLEVVRVVLM